MCRTRALKPSSCAKTNGANHTVVTVTSQIELTEAALGAAADSAIAAFDAATSLDELAAASRQKVVEQGYIPQARTMLGSLPKDQRKDAGKNVNMARGRVEKRFASCFLTF